MHNGKIVIHRKKKEILLFAKDMDKSGGQHAKDMDKPGGHHAKDMDKP